MNAQLLNELIRELHAEGRTILFSTHVLHQAERMCDRIVLIDRGTKVLDEELDSIRRRFDPRTITAEPLDDPGAWRDHASGVEGVDTVDLDEDGRVHARLRGDADVDRAMTDCLAAGSVRMIERARPTLGEVFFSLVGRRADHPDEDTEDDADG